MQKLSFTACNYSCNSYGIDPCIGRFMAFYAGTKSKLHAQRIVEYYFFRGDYKQTI